MNDKPSIQPSIQPMPSGAPQTPKPIRMKELIFDKDTIVPLADCEGATRRVHAGKAKRHSTVTVEIQLEPWIRHHRVREIRDGKVTSEFLVPESSVIGVLEPTVAS